MFEGENCIRGFHVYKEIWTPEIGENFHCTQESDNREDPFAVAVRKGSDTVGHVPQKISCICSLFLQNCGSLTCLITGDKRVSWDLLQGDLEIPSLLPFDGQQEIVEKLESNLARCKDGKQALPL